jgi:hypothetical protein
MPQDKDQTPSTHDVMARLLAQKKAAKAGAPQGADHPGAKPGNPVRAAQFAPSPIRPGGRGRRG